ncbi:MAG: teichoic acid D-Ala incorporation-associated protein DltX [Oscillospiraceae bacterium]|nr:teichoic acid D-Ala incorporation-associated protein DltX [Oscillospiraceae bacterium]
MKQFTNFINKIKNNKIISFILWTLFFLACMLALYFYYLYSNNFSAPSFVYNQF